MKRNSHSRRRGGILLTTLVFAVIIATILAGLGTLIISYYSRVSTESQYASVINLADAGANYELRKITQNVNNADLPSQGNPPGTTVAWGPGKFRVYCTMSDGVTSWDKSTVPFCILCTGTIGLASRTIRISATSLNGNSGSAAVFAVVSGTISSSTISGSVATDGSLSFSGGSASVTNGTIYLDGPGAILAKAPSTAYTEIKNAAAVSWPTVSAVALSTFPNSGATAPGGLSYLSIYNDNASAIPPISANTINLSGSGSMKLVGKAGGANYYVTTLSMTGGSTLTFDNTLGPITIWEASTTNAVTISGGTAAIKMPTDASKAVKFYLATAKGVNLTGGSELDAGIYNPGTGDMVTISGGSYDYASVICDNLTYSGGSTFNGTTGYFTAPGSGTYQFNNAYLEVNGL